ncbi:hypothetical protein JCM8547_000370 [Rhodosporidiobolus lusitaniae]
MSSNSNDRRDHSPSGRRREGEGEEGEEHLTGHLARLHLSQRRRPDPLGGMGNLRAGRGVHQSAPPPPSDDPENPAAGSRRRRTPATGFRPPSLGQPRETGVYGHLSEQAKEEMRKAAEENRRRGFDGNVQLTDAQLLERAQRSGLFANLPPPAEERNDPRKAGEEERSLARAVARFGSARRAAIYGHSTAVSRW